MDKVHIVFKGTDHEAQDVKGVFTTRSAAEQKVTELLARRHDEDGRPTYKPRGENEWCHRGQYVLIEEHTVG
jgi:hypothetical protein